MEAKWERKGGPCAHALQMAQEGALQGRLPRDCPQLPFVLSLMQLAVDGRNMLKNRVYK